MHAQPRRRTYPVLATLILLLAAGLRIAGLGSASIWWDEGFSYWILRQPLPELIHQSALDTHPPTYYLIAHAWRLLAGDSPFALRFPSAMFGLAAVALMIQAGRALRRGDLGRRIGLVAGLLAAMIPLWVQWSQQIRDYAQASAFAALALLAAIKVLDEKTRHPWRWAAILALGEGGGLMSLYLAAGLIVALNLGALVAVVTRRRRWELVLRWGIAQAVALAMFLPWYIYSSRQEAWQPAYPPIDLWFTVRLYLSIFLAGVSENIDKAGPLIALAAAILAGAAWFAWKDALTPLPPLPEGEGESKSPVSPLPEGDGEPKTPVSPLPVGEGPGVRAHYALLLSGVILPPILMYILFLLPRSARFNIPSPDGRHFLVMSGPIYLLLGWGIAAATRRARPAMLAGWAALAALAGMLGWSLVSGYYPSLVYVDDYASLASTLQAMVQPGDTVVLNNDYEWPVFAFHYTGDFVPIAQGRVRGPYAADLLKPVIDSSQGVWLVQTPFAAESDPDGLVPAALAAHAVRVDHFSYPMAELYFYALTPGRASAAPPGAAIRPPADLRPAALAISNGAALTGFVAPRQPVSAGDSVGIGLSWHVDPGAAGGEWPVALSVVGADGSAIAAAQATLSSPSPGDYFQVVDVFLPTFGETGRARIELAAGPNSAGLGEMDIHPTHAALPPEAAVPADAKSLGARLGDHIRLIAVSLPDKSVWKPGETIRLTMYWSTDAPLAEHDKGFVHLTGQAFNTRLGNHLWGQDDHEPGGGFAPTTLWRPGAVIRDDYAVAILKGAPDGEYQLEVGMYRLPDFANLPISGADGPMPLMTIRVER